MIYYKTDEEIELIRESSLLVSKTLAEVARNIKPGIRTIDLDKIAETFILDHNAKPAFKGYRGFPGSICTSVNEAVVHGIPGDDELNEGDIISVDCGVLLNGFYGDSAYTFAVGEIDDKIQELMKVTKDALESGVDKARKGNRIGDIGAVVQSYVEKKGYSVVRELVGHGIGKGLHEEPEVPNYGRQGTGTQIKEGLVIAIEPMVNIGVKEIKQKDDGWTIITADQMPSAHYEHSVAVRKEGPEKLSDFSYIEKAIKNNVEITLVE